MPARSRCAPFQSPRRPSVALLIADGVDEIALAEMEKVLAMAGARSSRLAPHGGTIAGVHGTRLRVDHRLATVRPTMFDALYIPGGTQSIAALRDSIDTRCFIEDAHRHGKSIAAVDEGYTLLDDCALGIASTNPQSDSKATGRRAFAVTAVSDFVAAIFTDRHWDRRPEHG